MLPEWGCSRRLLLLVVLLTSAFNILVVHYKHILVDQVLGVAVCFRRADSWLTNNSLEQLNTSRAGCGNSLEQQQQQQLLLGLHCTVKDFANGTSCSLADASLYFVCNKHYPRTGAFVAGSSAWKAFGNCGISTGACLLKEQTQGHQQQSGDTNTTASSATANNPASAGIPDTLQLAQQQKREESAQYIVVMGDSQGKRYAVATMKGLQALGAQCKVQKREIGVEYFGSRAELEYRQQECSGCSSFLARCTHPTTKAVVELEYLRMEYILDFEITEKPRSHWDENCKEDASALPSAGPPCKWAWTTQQFYFERYLARRPPNQLHIFQNIHDCARRSKADFSRDLTWFITLLNSTIGQSASTEIYVWGATAVNPDKQPSFWRNVTSAECVEFMSKATQAAIYPMVAQTVHKMQAGAYKSRSSAAWHATFDMYTPTSQRLDLNEDGVHFVHHWFDIVGRQMLLGGFCADKQ